MRAGPDIVLVERERESAQLASSLSECLSGKGGVVALTGPVGAGKTALLRYLARDAVESGFVHLNAKASRAERRAPMGVMGQLLGGAQLPDEPAQNVMRLLDDAVLTAMLRERDDESAEHVDMRVRRGLSEALLELAARAPLLVSVDDAHLADAESMHCLLHLARRIESARVLVVLTSTAGLRQPWPRLAAELLSLPHARQLRLSLLSPEGVAALLAGLGDTEPESWHRLSGGSPLLLGALVEDYRTEHRGAPGPESVAGEAFTQAVQTCLYRGDESMLPVAQALAVLGEPASPTLLGDLLGDACPSPASGLAAATEAGIVDAGRFRHPRSAVAVLDAMSPHERAELHDRVAHALYRDGAAAVTVARHALAARRTEAPWSLPVLREAAEQAMEQDDTAMALDCLRLAERGRVDVAERAGIHAALLRAKWRLDPTSAERHARELLPLARAGMLRIDLALMLVKHLMWFGRPAEAAEVLDSIGDSAGPDAALAAFCVRIRFGYFYPGAAAGRPDAATLPRASTLTCSSGRLRVRTANIIDAVHRDGVTEQSVADARAILQQHRLDDHTWESILISLGTVLLAERLDEAADWCDRLLKEAEDRRVPTWRALLSAMRATISLRQGGVSEAERYAHAALSHIPPKGLGVFIGSPISVLLLVATHRGQFDEAQRLLAVPVPEAMFQTPFGLSYLRARGRFHLARGSREEAVEDFEACGELMVRWGLDLPALAPWRTDLAEARRVIEPEPAGGQAIDELSDAERRVAALAAQGHTNQQIARQLFITVSTVEQHLTRVYRKLRINRRSDLPFSLVAGLRNTA